MKNIKENYSFDSKDTETVIDGRFNISKVDDPIELKRLNNYITTVVAGNAFSSLKDNLNQARLKLNLLGFDFDIPKKVNESGTFNHKVPLRRFGGVIGIDDKAQKLDNPYGPGPKFDIAFESINGILTAKITPSDHKNSVQEAAPAAVAAAKIGIDLASAAAKNPAVRKAVMKGTEAALMTGGSMLSRNQKKLGEESEDPMSFKEKLRRDIARLKAIKNRDEGEEETLQGMMDALKKHEKKETNEGFSFKEVQKLLKK